MESVLISARSARTPHALEVDALNVPILRDMGLGLRVFEDSISNALSRRLQAKDAAKIGGKGQQTQCQERQHRQTQSVKRCTELSDFSPLAAAHNGGLLLKRPLLQHSTLDRLELQDCVERISRRLAESRRRREITDVEASTDKKPNPSPTVNRCSEEAGQTGWLAGQEGWLARMLAVIRNQTLALQ